MTTTTSRDAQVALLEERGWVRVDKAGNEWAHESREGVVFSTTAALRREQQQERVHTTKS